MESTSGGDVFLFNQQYNFTYNSGKRGYSAISKTKNTKTTISHKVAYKRQSVSYINNAQSFVRGILKLEPRTTLSQTSNAKSNVEAFAAVMYYAKPDLNIFDMYDKRLAILSNEGADACPFWDAIYREELNKGGTFTFTVPANHHDSQFVVTENKVAFRDKDDNLRLFVIKETEEIDGNDGPLIEVYCDPEYIDELNDIVIEDKRPQDRTAEYALGQVLEDSRWEVGEVAELGTNTTNFYFMTGIESINRILDVWGGELRDRIEVDGNKITGRYIDILTRRGADTGKRWEIDKDIIEITRLTQSYPKTALYGRGASLETEGGGFSRLLTFEDVEWSVANGDPVDKPKGQKWVGDMDALQHYGRRMISGRNLTTNSGKFNDISGWSRGVIVTKDGYKAIQVDSGSLQHTRFIRLEPDTEYVYSAWLMSSVDIPSNQINASQPLHNQMRSGGSNSGARASRRLLTTDHPDIIPANTWFKIEILVKTRADIDSDARFVPYIYSGSNNIFTNQRYWVRDFKLEKGNKATDWSPAPEDVINDASYHRMGIYENGNIEDPEELLWATWNELQEQKRPFENYTLDLLLYAEKAGLDHEKVRLGDTSIALDRRFARPIEVEERIIAYEYDVANPDDKGKVELGQFRELFSDDKRLDQIQAQLDSAQGKANHPEIDDDSFPDVKPETPTNFTADPLFKIIQLKWDFVASSYIAAYELYASQTPNFNPTSDRLVWRGKTGGYAFEADTDEQWYFRLRAVNTHGTASDFTSEISAQTTKINAGIDVAPYTITDQLIAQNANIDGAKIGDATITSAKINSLIGDLITAGIIKDANDRVLFNLDDGILNINDGAIKITRPDGAVWLEDGMVRTDYSVFGQIPEMTQVVIWNGAPSHWAFFANMQELDFVQSEYFGGMDGRGIPGVISNVTEIRDSNYRYSVRYQRFWYVHNARYLKVRYQIANHNRVGKHAVDLYEVGSAPGGTNSVNVREIYEKGDSGTKTIIADLGIPSYQSRGFDFRIGWNRDWTDREEFVRFRILSISQTDYI